MDLSGIWGTLVVSQDEFLDMQCSVPFPWIIQVRGTSPKNLLCHRNATICVVDQTSLFLLSFKG